VSKTIIGIDVGSRLTKIVGIEPGGKLGVTGGAIFPTPRDGSRQLDAQVFRKELDSRIGSAKLRHAALAVTLPPNTVTALTVYLPLMSRKELLYAALNEAKQKMIPVTGPHHIFETAFLGEVMVNKVPRAEVIVIRTEKTFVTRILDVCKTFDTHPSLIAPLANVACSLVAKEAWKKSEAVMCVDFGATNLMIAIYRDQNMVFMRNIVFGMDDIVQDFSHQLGVPVEKVEQAIKQHGVPDVAFDLKDKVAIAEEIMRQKYEATSDSDPSNDNQVNLLELRMLWQPHLERFSQEIKRSLVFYKEQPETREIKQVYFFGGGSSAKNFVSLIAGQVGNISGTLVLPFKDLAHEIPNDNPVKNELLNTALFSSAAACALAIPLTKTSRQPQVNFLPVEIKKKDIIAARRVALVISGVAVFLVLAAVSVQMAVSTYAVAKKIKRLDKQLDSVKTVAESLKELSQSEATVNQKTGQIETLQQQRRDYLLPLQDLAERIPEDVLVKEAVLSGSRLELKGAVTADYEEAVSILSSLVSALKRSRYFSNIVEVPFEMEKLSPESSGQAPESELVLTKSKARDFSLSADIVTPAQ
jgi:Tfp pilus assembly PilM family ATPase/Tfp pilus assembly protein PilN